MGSYYVAEISNPASTGNVSYTGFGGQPKAIFVIGSQRTTYGGADETFWGMFGMASGSSSQACVGWAIENNVGSASRSHQDNAAVIRGMDESGSTKVRATLVSFDSDGMTLNWTTAPATAYKFLVFAIWGSDLTNVGWKEWTTPGSTGNQAKTGVGFQPDTIFTITNGQTVNTAGSQATCHYGIGCANNEATDKQLAIGGRLDSATSNGYTHFQDAYDMRVPNTSAGTFIESQIVSFDSDGWTDNFTTVPTARYAWTMCFKGLSTEIITIETVKTSTTGTKSHATTITPGAFMSFFSKRTAYGLATDFIHGVSFAASASLRGVNWFHSLDVQNPYLGGDYSNTKAWHNGSANTYTADTIAEVDSFGASSIVLNYTTVPASSAWRIPFIVFASSAAADTGTAQGFHDFGLSDSYGLSYAGY